jgi:hypothetical protein
MRVGMRYRGHVIGVDPSPQAHQKGDAQFPVYRNRTEVGGWEHLELRVYPDGTCDARFEDANRRLSIPPTGPPESRAVTDGDTGAWERFYATDQPDGSSLLYRFESGVLCETVLTIEAVS